MASANAPADGCVVFRARSIDNYFAPDIDPALRTGIAAEVAMLRDLHKCVGKRPVQGHAPAIQG
jgi:hypothetical protein